jgi:hypothetical protein
MGQFNFLADGFNDHICWHNEFTARNWNWPRSSRFIGLTELLPLNLNCHQSPVFTDEAGWVDKEVDSDTFLFGVSDFLLRCRHLFAVAAVKDESLSTKPNRHSDSINCRETAANDSDFLAL